MKHYNHKLFPGIDGLLVRHKDWLAGRRLGLISHPAAVTREGMSAGERLWREPGLNLKSLFGPEHGFFGTAAAGEELGHQKHPAWRIPIYSLYGRTRKPTPAMFRNLDVIIVDLQDLAARPYTFVSTLRYVMELASEMGKTIVVADRPVPLPRIIDGPLIESKFESFVGCVRAPMHYGMTPGEMALWLKRDLGLKLDLRVARMRGYSRGSRTAGWPPWITPSPGIRSWETGRCYLATIFGEALPAIHIGQNNNLVFQVFAAPWLKSRAVCERLNDSSLPGVQFFAHPYRAAPAKDVFDGVRIAIRNSNVFRPVMTGIAILVCLHDLYGRRKIWGNSATRPEFFDKLYGTDCVRQALLDGENADNICRRWQRELDAFARTRQPCLLYPSAD